MNRQKNLFFTPQKAIRGPGRPRVDRSRQSLFGGALLKGNPRYKRPIDFSKPLLVSLKTHHEVRQDLFLLKRIQKRTHKAIRAAAHHHGIFVSWIKNSGSEIHLQLKVHKRSDYVAFIRGVTCKIRFAARSKVNSTSEASENSPFWAFRPHTRIVGKALQLQIDFKKYFKSVGFSHFLYLVKPTTHLLSHTDKYARKNNGDPNNI